MIDHEAFWRNKTDKADMLAQGKKKKNFKFRQLLLLLDNVYTYEDCEDGRIYAIVFDTKIVNCICSFSDEVEVNKAKVNPWIGSEVRDRFFRSHAT